MYRMWTFPFYHVEKLPGIAKTRGYGNFDIHACHMVGGFLDAFHAADFREVQACQLFPGKGLHRGTQGSSSCAPGWIKYCEHYFPDMTENLSTCKSPQQMFRAIAKSYYAQKEGLKPEDIVSVAGQLP